MRVIALILKEIWYRKINFALSLIGVVVAVSLFVALATGGKAYRQETRKIQLGLGQNMRIIPRETRMDHFWTTGFSEFTMPEEYVYRFATLEHYEYTHLTAVLQKKITWRDREVILTGILPEVMPPGRNQPPMTFSVDRGEVFIGHDVGQIFELGPGDQLELLGRSFQVHKRLSPAGNSDDIRIYGHLHDIQEALGMEGRINEIKALECLCLFESGLTDLDPLTLAEQQLAEILPEGKVLLLKGIADIRQKQRAALEGYLGLIMPLIIIACGVWIGVLAMMNVRERFEEIGIMRAIGYGTRTIASLFLGRSVLIGLCGAVVGFAVGTGLAMALGLSVFQVSAQMMEPDYVWLIWAIVLAPAFSAVSSFIPAVSAITWDPASTLSKG
jgi:ABC-type antimicrobial peptide transport system permease subunit